VGSNPTASSKIFKSRNRKKKENMKFITFNTFGKITAEDVRFGTDIRYSFNDNRGEAVSASKNLIDATASFSYLNKDLPVKEEKVARTFLVETLTDNVRKACTVVFNKKPDLKVIKETFYNLYPNKGGILSEDKFKSLVDDNLKVALDGEERTLVGYYLGKSDADGRLLFFDAEAFYHSTEEYELPSEDAHKKAIRLVDPRTIKSLIINNTTYLVKK
jgi:hypothetical protein